MKFSRPRLRLGLFAALAAGLVSAQGVDPLDVRGVVLEPGTNLPVAGAQVTLYEFGEDASRFVIRKVYATTSTDSRGTFQFRAERFGDYFLDAKKEGYIPLTAGVPGDVNPEAAESSLNLSKNQPPAEIKFLLMRPGELSGRVVDEDGKPVAGLSVAATTSVNLPIFQQPKAVTDLDGSFTIPKLTPERYLLHVSPKAGDSEIVTTTFTADDLKVVDQDLGTAYWPGGADARSASPIPVSPGASTNLGTITVRKAAYYRAHVTVVADECRTWQFSVNSATSPLHFMVVPCAKEFLVRNLKPGSYWFVLTNGQDGEKNRQALVPVEITRENVDVTLNMTPGAIVSGRIIAMDDGKLPELKGVTIQAAPSITGLFPGPPAQPDSEGRFLFQNLAGIRYQIRVQVLTRKFYVKEIRYNGVPAPDGIITPSADGRVDIVIDDQPATVTGTVVNGDKPASRASVLVVQWPAPPGDNNQGIVSAAASGEDGRFQIPGIAPGEYRVMAIATGDGRFVDFSNVTRFLGSAEKITLERGGSQSISQNLIDPTR